MWKWQCLEQCSYLSWMLVVTNYMEPSPCFISHLFSDAVRSLNCVALNDKKKLRGLSPQAKYTDRATAAVGEVVPTFAGRGVLRGQGNGSPRPLISVF
jgi:hypothetical protein